MKLETTSLLFSFPSGETVECPVEQPHAAEGKGG